MKAPPMAEKQRAFREAHAPDRAPFVGIWLREGDALCLAAGVIPDSLRQTAVEAIEEFWTDEATKAQRLSEIA